MRKALINIAMGILASLTANLSLPEKAKRALQYVLDMVGDVVGVLTDSNPNNASQVVELLDAKKIQLAELGLDVVKEVLTDRIKDAGVRDGAIKMVVGLEEILKVILIQDENK
jgi:hypothetical protein